MSSKAMSLKGRIKNYAKAKNIAAQVVLQIRETSLSNWLIMMTLYRCGGNTVRNFRMQVI